MIKTFISYDNQHIEKKDEIKKIIEKDPTLFKDISLDYALDLSNNEQIRQKIRDEYITDATVLILIATKDARGRKFIDWEIAAAMYDGSKRKDGKRNDICGIVVVDYVDENIRTKYEEIRKTYESAIGKKIEWTTLQDDEIKKRYHYLPERIVNSMIKGADITVIPSSYVEKLLKKSIEKAHKDKNENKGKYIFNNLRTNNSPRK